MSTFIYSSKKDIKKHEITDLIRKNFNLSHGNINLTNDIFKYPIIVKINKLKSNVTTKDVIEKGKKKGEFVEAPYKTTPKDFVKIEETLNTINRTINSVNDPKLLNLKTLYLSLIHI